MAKTLTRKWQPKMKAIEGKDGMLLTNIDDILDRWKEYCEKLYNHEVQIDLETITMLANKESQHHYDKDPPILKDEVIAAIEKLKNNKSPGTDNITAELLKAGGEPVINILYKTNNTILQSGEWLDRLTESIVIPLPKGNTKKMQQ